MAERDVDFLLIGGGLACAVAARTLREQAPERSIMLVGRESDPPYERPPCSKEYLQGSQSREDTFVEQPAWYEENRIELLTRTSVTALDAAARTAKLSTREEVGFSKALLATGANVRRLQVEGCDLEGIHYLRTLGNSDTIRADLGAAERVVMIGGSYIACEVAASLTASGRHCAMVMQEELPLERTFGAGTARFFADQLAVHGVAMHGHDELERFEGDGRVTKVITKAGREMEADLVVI
ncbi:MAG: NAD(P)/FAD-dependent oxidoreductase, partial [Solirubrobacteraceae bacterium]